MWPFIQHLNTLRLFSIAFPAVAVFLASRIFYQYVCPFFCCGHSNYSSIYRSLQNLFRRATPFLQTLFVQDLFCDSLVTIKRKGKDIFASSMKYRR